jgi:hypothetical protein
VHVEPVVPEGFAVRASAELAIATCSSASRASSLCPQHELVTWDYARARATLASVA